MELRELLAADVPALERLHASMNLGYKLPDARTAFFVKTGIFDDAGRMGSENPRLVTAVLGRVTSEAYLLLDRTWSTPAARWEAAQRTIVCAAEQAKLLGMDDVHVFPPPSIEKFFAKRLKTFGFTKVDWPCYVATL